MNQQEFWSRIGVTQSGGSRYEAGRAMPKPVRELLRLVHVEGVSLSRAKARGANVSQFTTRPGAEKATGSATTLRILGGANGRECELLISLPLPALSKSQTLRLDVRTFDQVVLQVV